MSQAPCDSMGCSPYSNRAIATIIEGDFEWDSSKAESNLVKHGVSVAEAATVFADPFAVYLDDGSGVGRTIVIGMSLRERVLFVVHIGEAYETGSSARDRPHRASGESTRLEINYETGKQTPCR